jgi:hypothetical protein
MATRRTFLHNTAAVGAGLMLAQAQTVHAADETGYIDKLVDADGRYAAAPLPFAYDALEPVIDARTVELHYTFHHKPAVAAANKAGQGAGCERLHAREVLRERTRFPAVKPHPAHGLLDEHIGQGW